METAGDSKVTAATNWLRSRLEEAFITTSYDCRIRQEKNFISYQSGNPIVNDGIREWRRKSVTCIREGFNEIFEALGNQQSQVGGTIADIVENLTWEVTDKAFNWVHDDGNSSKFEEWQQRAGANYQRDQVLLLWPDCNRGLPCAKRLSADFRMQFEYLLDQLRDETFLKSQSSSRTTAGVPDSVSTTTADVLVHSEDYRTITLRDKKYSLSTNQALIIKALHEAQQKGLPGLSTHELQKAIKTPKSRIRDSFRKGDGSRVWKELITHVPRGVYALKLTDRITTF